jgi:uncharacterized protein YjdB
LTNGAVATSKSYAQVDLQSEASHQVCVDMSSADATAEFTFVEAADGLVIRYSVPDGESAVIGVWNGDTKITSLTSTSKWSWESLWNNGDPNNNGITNKNPKMRFDEVRYQLPDKLTKLKLVRESGNPSIDFIEMEPVSDALPAPDGAVVYSGDGSTLQAFIDANGGKTIFVPSGVYNIHSQLYFGVPKTKLVGAGMWYSQLNFTVTDESNGGLRANAEGICYSDLFITTDMTTRTKGYAGILGVYTQGSTIRNMWVEHCATGAWIGQYVGFGPAYADGFVMSNCRFRNTYADGVNLCKGTRNAIVEHCNFRNNGDDGMAIWSAEGLECINNTFRNNTVEHVWRAAGAGLYGGKDNKFYDIIIKDNVEIGITINNYFPGVGFNDNGTHVFHDITIIGCGTFNDTDNSRVGAINISVGSAAGTKVQNIRMYNMNINDSKCDGIRFFKSSGSGIYNIKMENVTIDGTGEEYPDNNINNTFAGRGYAVIFERSPAGNATYCNLNYANLGGNSNGVAFGIAQKGSFSWTEQTGCEMAAVTGIHLAPADTSIAGGAIVQLVPLFSPESTTNKIVSYTSSDPKVATVDYDGTVTGLSKGETTITVTAMDGGFTAAAKINVVSDALIYYKIKNRWQNTYVYDAGDRVRYSASVKDNTYLWKLETVDGVIEIRNVSTGDYMHIEDLLGFVQCTAISGNLSSKWSLEDAEDGFVRLKSELIKTNYMHIENLQNQVQYGAAEASWWSAQWLLEPVITATSFHELSFEKTAVIYPNPSKGDFNLTMGNFTSGESVSIAIFNLAGQAIYTCSGTIGPNGFSTVKVQAGHILSSGNYILVAKGNTDFARVKLLISKP